MAGLTLQIHVLLWLSGTKPHMHLLKEKATARYQCVLDLSKLHGWDSLGDQSSTKGVRAVVVLYTGVTRSYHSCTRLLSVMRLLLQGRKRQRTLCSGTARAPAGTAACEGPGLIPIQRLQPSSSWDGLVYEVLQLPW